MIGVPCNLHSMDNQHFLQACALASQASTDAQGIGTLMEKTVHAVLKYYFAPDSTHHEIKVGKFIVDILQDDRIIEVQTRNLGNLANKLSVLLDTHAVTVVYPIIRKKWLIWVDMQTAQATAKRRSPKTGSFADAFRELYAIRQFLDHPGFTLCLVLYDGEERRHLNGWSNDKKRGSTRIDRIPIQMVQQQYLHTPADYAQLLPNCLPTPFTSQDLVTSTRISKRVAWAGLKLLCELGVLQRVGKQGNSILYQPTPLY